MRFAPGNPRSLAVHVLATNGVPGLSDDDEPRGCCMGEAMRGPTGCTCWTPVFDLEQQPIKRFMSPRTRTKCCGDCAYRNGSPERAEDGGTEHLQFIAEPDVPAEFWCHAGMRKVIAWRHPDGREIPVAPDAVDDYKPPTELNAAGVQCCWRADGTPAARCAGWNAHRTAPREGGDRGAA